MNEQKTDTQAPQFAVFHGSEEITPEMYREVLDFCSFVEQIKSRTGEDPKRQCSTD